MSVLLAAVLLFRLALCAAAIGHQQLAVRQTPQVYGWSVMATKCAPTASKSTEAEARQAIESAVNKAVPPGASRSQVEAWLRSQKMESQLIAGSTLRRSDYVKILHDHGYHPSELGGMVISFRRQSHVRSVFLATLLFFLSKQGRVIEFSVENVRDEERRRMPGKPTLVEIRRAIKRALPVGSIRTKIEAWLDKEKIRHSHLDAKTHRLRDVSTVRDSHLPPSVIGGMTQATVPHVAEQGWSRIDIQLTFFFDNRNRLIASSVKEVGGGP